MKKKIDIYKKLKVYAIISIFVHIFGFMVSLINPLQVIFGSSLYFDGCDPIVIYLYSVPLVVMPFIFLYGLQGTIKVYKRAKKGFEAQKQIEISLSK